MQTPNKISVFSRILLVISSVLLIATLYVPIWYIELDAPQYPEGLGLKIHAHKIGGDVDIVNGLNHYIGMKTLHTEDFIEFTLLPYILGFFALFALVAAILGKRRVLNILLISFIVFGVVSMADFWRWEYDYGHDLNPDAAIIVPGMAYQPPLIGFKQLLNFGAYSMPDTGGWLIVGSGLLMLLAVFMEYRKLKKARLSASPAVAVVFAVLFLSACESKPQAIKLNSDNCAFCEMTIADKRFGAELLTQKGRVYKFDDLSCMLRYMKEKKGAIYKGIYISDYLSPNALTEIEKVTLIEGESVGSPMGGNIAAFSSKDSALVWQRKLAANVVLWDALRP